MEILRKGNVQTAENQRQKKILKESRGKENYFI